MVGAGGGLCGATGVGAGVAAGSDVGAGCGAGGCVVGALFSSSSIRLLISRLAVSSDVSG